MADPLDIIDLPTAQDAVKSFGPANATDLADAITGISGAIDALCGPVITREVTATLSAGCSGPLLFSNTPVYEVSEVVETSGNTPTTLTGDDWQLDAEGHYARLFRRSGGYDSTWAPGRRNVAVTYLAGRFEDTNAVSYRWREGFKSLLIAKWQWEAPAWTRNRDNTQFDGDGFVTPFNLEAAIRSTFESELLPPGIA